MTNKILKGQVLETVTNQLKMNDPKCVAITFRRLIDSGYTEQEAKEMIGSVLIEEMYYILKDKREFDEQKYEAKLNSLGRNLKASKNDNFTSKVEEDNIQELLERIAYNIGGFPREILKEIAQKKEEAIPLLLDILKKVRDNPEKYLNDFNYFGHIYAIYLLAQFRVKEAYPVFVDILRLPDEMPHDLFGDVICEAGSRILASICGSDISLIKALIENTKVDEYVRGQAIEALAILSLQDVIPREEVISYYKELLVKPDKIDNPLVMAELMCSCCDIYPEELYDEIKMSYKRDLVDESIIGMKDIEHSINMGKHFILSLSRNNTQLQFIYDVISELEDWNCFNKDKKYYHEAAALQKFNDTQTVIKGPKVGRNDPCPCGSGKKYKKCCGK